jgi:hypothetical protein
MERHITDDDIERESRDAVLWTMGRLDDLIATGLLKGQRQLTEKGYNEYLRLLGMGYIPVRAGVAASLREAGIPDELFDRVLDLVTRNDA